VTPYERLRELAATFLEGEDRSWTLTGAMEELISEHFADEDRFDDLLYDLSFYRPGGDSPYLDETGLCARLIEEFPELDN
jgi:hypothetical protein